MRSKICGLDLQFICLFSAHALLYRPIKMTVVLNDLPGHRKVKDSWACWLIFKMSIYCTGDFIAIYSFTYKRHQCLNDAQKIKWQNSRTDDNPGLVVVWNKKQDFDKMWDIYKACLIVWLHDISCDISPAWLVVMVTAAYCLILGASDDTPFCASISNV